MTSRSNARDKPCLETLHHWLEKIPYAMFLGIKAEPSKKDIIFILPKNKKFIGNPSLPALHGGVIGAFMEQAAALHLVGSMDAAALPKIINFSLDYLRPAQLRDTYASCILSRKGRFISNLTITAWQEHINQPNAIARAHFLTPETN
ncbi:MAG: PaaI family thioesterase [Halioglobus sp.]|nr:PaaI family thioesterase [Halioglobus sp.]